MDMADFRILYYLDLNSRYPAKKIASLAGMKSEKVSYRLKNLFESGVVRRCYPEIDRAKLGYCPFKVYLQFQSITREKLEEIYDYLASHDNTGWVVTCIGRWDMIFAVWATDVKEFNEAYEAFLAKYHHHILRKSISISVEFFLANKKWLSDNPKPYIVRVGAVPQRIVDSTDYRILHYLGSKGRAPIIEISDSLGLPPSTVSQRIKEMQKNKVILSFRTDLDLGKFDRLLCKSFVYLTKSSKAEEERLLDYCFRHPDITAVVRCVGPWDFEIEAHSRSFDEFTEMMNDVRNRYPNMVRNFEAVVINKETGMMYAPKKNGRSECKAVADSP